MEIYVGPRCLIGAEPRNNEQQTNISQSANEPEAKHIGMREWESIGPALQVKVDLVHDVFPSEQRDVMRAAEMAQNPA